MKTGHHQIGVQIKRAAIRLRNQGTMKESQRCRGAPLKGLSVGPIKFGLGLGGRRPERRERLGKELPEGLSECQA